MTLTEVVELVAEDVGAPQDLAWGFVDETIMKIVELLDRGEEVKIRGLGTFRWKPIRAQRVARPDGSTLDCPAGWKLRVDLAGRFKNRRQTFKPAPEPPAKSAQDAAFEEIARLFQEWLKSQ